MTTSAKLTLIFVFFLAAIRSLTLLLSLNSLLNVDVPGSGNRASRSGSRVTSNGGGSKNNGDEPVTNTFSGQVVRTFAGATKLQEAAVESQFSLPLHTTSRICEKWGVVTTIQAPTEAIQKFATLKDWCLVIVADIKTPTDGYLQLTREGNGRVVFLSVEDQKDMAILSSFVKRMPYKSFARKNIGYLFAIRHGAQAIFDFDDEHVLKDAAFSTTPRTPLVLLHDDDNDNQKIRDSTWIVRTPIVNDKNVAPPLAFNPLPWMHPSSGAKIWPREFPLRDLESFEDSQNHVHSIYLAMVSCFPCAKPLPRHSNGGGYDSATTKATGSSQATTLRSIPRSKIAVVQATCDQDPDVDTIYRLTRPLPVTFDEAPAKASRLLVPPGRYAPYNAQATTHMYNAFWGLILPYSSMDVSSMRVADIWRSYFTQRILHDLGLAVVYSPPLVVRQQHNNRTNAHNHMADQQAKKNLYTKTEALWDFLSTTWMDSSPELPATTENLAMALHERNYIGLEDVLSMPEWLLELISDLQAEQDLYMKTEALLKFLSTWQDTSQELPARIENLAIALYERDYIGLEDVLAMQEWLLALMDAGYQFPSLSGAQELSRVMKDTPVLHEQAIVVPPVYNLGGTEGDWKLYRNYIESKASSGTVEDWNEWLAGSKAYQEQNPELVPQGIVMSLVIMAKDEWPILKNNVLYHGHLLGFENLYIIDGSTNPRCTSFLAFARDQLGVNVIFSPANLNQLTGEMSMIGDHLAGSSDLIVKIDADEFVTIETNDASCQHDSVELLHPDCSLSPLPMKTFLQNRTNLEHFSGVGRLMIGSLWGSVQDQELCHAGRGNEVASYRYARHNHESFKSILDSRTLVGFDLGGHFNFRLPPHETSGSVFYTPVGILHAHARCFEHEVENCRKALISHGYLAESDSPKESMRKLKMYMGRGGCAIDEPGKMAIQGLSVHKVHFYASYLQGCNGATEETFYQNSNHLFSSAFSNPDFKVFMDEALSLYG